VGGQTVESDEEAEAGGLSENLAKHFFAIIMLLQRTPADSSGLHTTPHNNAVQTAPLAAKIMW
jgi:hypothetical protein